MAIDHCDSKAERWLVFCRCDRPRQRPVGQVAIAAYKCRKFRCWPMAPWAERNLGLAGLELPQGLKQTNSGTNRQIEAPDDAAIHGNVGGFVAARQHLWR